jgi:hypothetical protein
MDINNRNKKYSYYNYSNLYNGISNSNINSYRNRNRSTTGISKVSVYS